MRKIFGKISMNRIISGLMKKWDSLLAVVQVGVIRLLAALVYLFTPGKGRKVCEKKIDAQGDSDLRINLLGNIDSRGNAAAFERDLDSVKDTLAEAQLTITTVRGAEKQKLDGLLQKYSLNDVFAGKEYMHSCLFTSEAGNVGVVSYNRFSKKSFQHHVKIDLRYQILRLKKAGAGYIIVYINDRIKQNQVIGSREKKLFNFLAKIGADYIVGVTPNVRNSGATYSFLRKTARSVFSLGTFLSTEKNISDKRVIVRIVLRRENGRLKLIQETYYPFRRDPKEGMKSLLFDKAEIVGLDKKVKQYCGQIETEMSRLRPANRMLTVGQMFAVIGMEVPENLRYMSDYSVGKICARSYECGAGDVFFFRQPFNDPNDLVPDNPKLRLRTAKRMSKCALLIVSYRQLSIKTPYVVCPDTIEAHISVCAYLRSQFPTRYVGITGSVGKTSTKDLLYEVMSTMYVTSKSERNSNVQVKIGLDIQKLNTACEVFIQEIGGGRPGGASRHSRMVLPDVTVVTNIGDAHIGNFGTREKLMANKLAINEGMVPGGVMLLNGDDPLLAAADTPRKKILYAVHNKDADYYVEDIKEYPDRTMFYIVHNGERTLARLNVLGEHNILNAVCCFAIGEYYGIPKNKIVQGLAQFRTSGIRQSLYHVCGVHLFMDCYNASSKSMKSSMEVLSKIEKGENNKRIALIGDVTGMGELSQDVHREIAETIMSTPADHMVFFGSSIEETYKILKEKGFSCYYTSDRNDLNRHLTEMVAPGDVLLVKGSSKVLLEYSIDTVFGTRFTDQRLLDEVEFRRIKVKKVEYNLFEKYVTAVRTEGGMNSVSLMHMIGRTPVVNIGAGLGHKQLKSVNMPDSIRHIASNAFLDCAELSQIRFSTGLKFIGNSAFRNCTSLESVRLHEGLLHIGSEAFAGCTGLKELYIPESVAQIGKDAFRDCPSLQIHCKEGSYADQYLKKNGVVCCCE